MDWDRYRTTAAATLRAVRQRDITITDAWHRIDRLREKTSDTETENYLEGVIKEPDVDIHAIDRTIAQLETPWYVPVLPVMEYLPVPPYLPSSPMAPPKAFLPARIRQVPEPSLPVLLL